MTWFECESIMLLFIIAIFSVLVLSWYGFAATVAEQQSAVQLQPPVEQQQTQPAHEVPPPAQSPEEQYKERQEHMRLASISYNTRRRDLDTYFRAKAIAEASQEEKLRCHEEREDWKDQMERFYGLQFPLVDSEYCNHDIPQVPQVAPEVMPENISWIHTAGSHYSSSNGLVRSGPSPVPAPAPDVSSSRSMDWLSTISYGTPPIVAASTLVNGDGVGGDADDAWSTISVNSNGTHYSA